MLSLLFVTDSDEEADLQFRGPALNSEVGRVFKHFDLIRTPDIKMTYIYNLLNVLVQNANQMSLQKIILN
jgi:arginine repressor